MSLKTLTERFEEVNKIKENNKKIDKAVFNIEDVGDLLTSYKNLKEIEKSHQEENGKLRVEFEKVYEDNLTLANELEQEKEKNKEYEKQLDLDYVDKNYISKERIMQEIKNIEKRMETATNIIEYQKLHCAQEYLRGLLWEV